MKTKMDNPPVYPCLNIYRIQNQMFLLARHANIVAASMKMEQESFMKMTIRKINWLVLKFTKLYANSNQSVGI